MKYSDFVDAVATDLGTSKADTKKTVDAVFAKVVSVLAEKDSLLVPGLGNFVTKENPAKQGRNPSTGATIDIAAKTVAKFKPAKGLADRLNG